MSPCEMPGIKNISLTKNNLDDSIIQSVKSSILYYFSIEVWIYLFFDDEKLCCLLWTTDYLCPLFKRIVVLIDNSPDFLVTPVYRYIDIPVDLNYAIDPFIL